jgi:hypothetical protein
MRNNMKEKKISKKQSNRSETNNNQVKRSRGKDNYPGKSDQSKQDLNEHTHKDFD